MTVIDPKERSALPTEFAAVAPNNDTDLPSAARGFMVSVAGNVSVLGLFGDTPVTLTGLQPGVQYWGLIRRIRVTGTTATGIVGMY